MALTASSGMRVNKDMPTSFVVKFRSTQTAEKSMLNYQNEQDILFVNESEIDKNVAKIE